MPLPVKTRHATATAPIAGTRSEKFAVISTTMIITAIGAYATQPKSAIIPMTMKAGIVSGGKNDGKSRLRTTPVIPPIMPPITRPGAKTPPLPPEPMVREVVRILRKGRRTRTARGSIE